MRLMTQNVHPHLKGQLPNANQTYSDNPETKTTDPTKNNTIWGFNDIQVQPATDPANNGFL